MPQTTTYSDDQLLLAAQNDSALARDSLLPRFDPLLRRIVSQVSLSRVATRSDFVDDVVAEAYRLILDPSICRFQPNRGKATNYLTGLVYNAIRTISRQRRPVCTDLLNHDRLEPSAPARRAAGAVYRNTLASRITSAVDGQAEADDQLRLVFSARDSVDDALVSSHFLGGESLVGIAARIGVSHSTVSRRITHFLFDAKRRLASAGAA
jgi:DNA-directed RNA polymerase specialized sigma24 family protein